MAPRFLTSEAPDPATPKTLEDQMNALHNGLLPVVEDDGSELTGWCAAFSYVPVDVVKGFMELSKASYMPNHIKPRNRELAILAFVSISPTPYMLTVHGAREGGNPTSEFSSDQLDDALAGNVPQGLSEEEQAVYRLGKVLSTLNGPLDDESWKEFSSKLPKSEIVGIANFIGVFQWLTLLIRLRG